MVVRLSYISILHQTTTVLFCRVWTNDCLTSLFYIKPQLWLLPRLNLNYCLTSLFYIKPQLSSINSSSSSYCLTSLFYIKPQRGGKGGTTKTIVLHLYSTSNHNQSYAVCAHLALSYISILHQTTTGHWCNWRNRDCLTSLFYIKPQRTSRANAKWFDCLTSLFYIKPQRILTILLINK